MPSMNLYKILYQGIKKENISYYAFIALCFLIFCNINGIVFMFFNITAPFSPLVLLLSCISLAFGLKEFKNAAPLFILFLLFLVTYIYISTIGIFLFGEHHNAGAQYYDIYRKFFPTFLIMGCSYTEFVKAKRKGNLLLIIDYIIIFSLLACLVAAFSKVIGLNDVNNFRAAVAVDESRPGGLFGNPNESGAAFCFGVVLVLYRFLTAQRRNWLYFIALPIFIYGVGISFSRTAFIILPIIFFVFFVLVIFRYRTAVTQANRKWLVVLFVVFGVCGGAAVTNAVVIYNNLTYAQQSRIDQLADLASGNVTAKNTSHRKELTEKALLLIKEYYILGGGLSMMRCLPNYDFHTLGCHNSYLVVLGESGIIPFGLLLLFMVVFLVQSALSSPSRAVLGIGIFIVVFMNSFGSGHNAIEWRLNNVLLMLAVVLLHEPSKHKKTITVGERL